jgi:hypothetical protein
VATLSLPTGFSTTQTASITAMNSGDGNFNGSTSATFTEVVGTPRRARRERLRARDV